MKESVRKRLLDISGMMHRDARDQSITKDWVLTGPTSFDMYARCIEEAVAEESADKWAVIQSEIYPGMGNGNGMWAGFTLFDGKESAIKFIEKVIREEWTTTIKIPTENDEFREELLADHRGYHSDAFSEKWSEVCYSEDGTLAWAEIGDRVVKIEAVKVIDEVERVVMSC